MWRKLRALILVVLSFSTVLVACTKETPKEPEYTSKCTVYFNKVVEEKDQLTSVDLWVDSMDHDALQVIIKSDIIHTFVRQKYPEIEYDCKLEPWEDAPTLAEIVVTSTSQKYVADICNLIAEKFREVVDTSLDNITITVISVAEKPTKPNNEVSKYISSIWD